MRCFICNRNVHSKWSLYCSDECRLEEKARKALLKDMEEPISDGEKWAKIGASSSNEAMKSVYKLFKGVI